MGQKTPTLRATTLPEVVPHVVAVEDRTLPIPPELETLVVVPRPATEEEGAILEGL